MSNAANPLFALRGVRARFDERTVLSVDELEIEEGQVTVLVGENGTGKTTLLRILNGLIAPSEGSVHFRGTPAAADGCAALRRESVLVHQAPLLFRGSVGSNVAYGLRLRGMASAEAAERTAGALGRVGLAGFERRRAGALSGGEQQRVALARALALQPRVLLLDEPTAQVDAEARDELESLIRGLARDGATVIMSTHNRELAYRLCDRLMVMEGGVPKDVDENFLRGRVEWTDEQFAWFKTGETVLRCPARQGDFLVAVLACDEIILSAQPLVSSARNYIKGRISDIRPRGAGLLSVTVDCGVPMKALVTGEALLELGMAAGADCVVTFKASAVRLY